MKNQKRSLEKNKATKKDARVSPLFGFSDDSTQYESFSEHGLATSLGRVREKQTQKNVKKIFFPIFI